MASFSETADFLSAPLQPTVWPGEPVLMMLDDLEFQWKRGRLPSLLLAMELVMLAVLNADSPAKVCTAEATTAASLLLSCSPLLAPNKFKYTTWNIF